MNCPYRGNINIAKKEEVRSSVITRSHSLFLLITFTGLTGLEPATSRVTGARSNQLSYSPISSTLLIMHCLLASVN
jgi:hypothetical protein